MQPPLDKPRLFSVEEANRMLPLVRRIVSDIVSLSDQLDEHQFGLDALGCDVLEIASSRADVEERERLHQEIDAAEDKMDEYISELAELGLELQDASIGEVDFPTQVEGDDACFCWRLGEPEVAYWHWEDAGFGSRRLLYRAAGSMGGHWPPEATTP